MSMNLNVMLHAITSNLAKKSPWFRILECAKSSQLQLAVMCVLVFTANLQALDTNNIIFPRASALQNLFKAWRQPF
jgi:hypothetical protein